MTRQPAGTTRGALFVPGDGPLHRLNPLTKLIAVMWIMSASIVLPPTATMAVVLAGMVLAYATGVGAALASKLVATLVPLVIALVALHGFVIVRPDEVTIFGPLHVSAAGLAFAYGVAARIAGVLVGTLLFVITTRPGDLLASFDATGLSPEVGYLIASPLLLIEPFSLRARAIRDAQRARGMDLNGSLRARVVALPALLVPLFTLALSDLDHRVMVLESRAFRCARRRTVLDAPGDTSAQSRFRRIVGTLAVLQLGVLLIRH